MRCRCIRVVIVLMSCLALPSCALIGKGMSKLPWKKKKKQQSGKDDDASRLVGTVEMVNPEQRFVLIRTHGKLAIGAGQELTVMDPSGAQSKVKVSIERKLDFLTADIIDGTPRTGSMVLLKPDKKAPPPPPADPNQPPASPDALPLQPPTEPPVQPPPLTPVSPNEFTKPAGAAPPARSPIPPQPVAPQPAPTSEPGAAIPAPGQIQLPPVVR